MSSETLEGLAILAALLIVLWAVCRSDPDSYWD